LKYLIIWCCKIVYWFGKIFGKDSNIIGKMIFKIDDSILKKIEIPDNIIAVTGSNGKSSTVGMIYKVLMNSGFSICCNVDESDQLEGIVTMIIKNINMMGSLKKDVIVIDCSEKNLKSIFEYLKPKYLVITNIYRDQIPENGHSELIYQNINKVLTQDIHLILNADDPLSSLLGYKRENVTYFGINQNSICSKENISMFNDGKYCPNCKSQMQYDYFHFNHIGSYHCKKCGYSRKNPSYAITDLDLVNGQIIINKKYRISMSLCSIYHAYDLLATFAVARIFGVEEEKIVSILTDIANKKNKEWELNGHQLMFVNSKYCNPISFNQSLIYVVHQKINCIVIINIDEPDIKKFTCNTSWIWDIDFELLKSDSVRKIILTGKSANDVAVRLENTVINMNKVLVIQELESINNELKENYFEKIFVIDSTTKRMDFLNRRPDKWK